MTYAEVTEWVLGTHGAIFLAALTTYLKYGDLTKLFDRFPQEYRKLQQAVRDKIASDLADHLRPVVRDSTSVRSSVLNLESGYIEKPVDVSKSEIYYQAIRDFVTNSSGALVDYRRVSDLVKVWRAWANRLSWSILSLVFIQPAMLFITVLVLYNVDADAQIPVWLALLGSVPTAGVILGAIVCLIIAHIKQSAIYELKEHYESDP